jgi:hypothetical protein
MAQVPDELARRIFERDKYTCQGCKKLFKSYLDCTGEETTALIKLGHLLVVDHKDNRSEDESNLQALCFSCNAAKSGRTQRNFKLYAAIKSLGACMTYYPSLARVLGLKESIFLCQLIYWTPRGRHEKGEGWIYKSAEEMEIETALSYKEQIRLRRQLVEKKLIEENYDRTQHRLYFRVRVEALDLLGEHITNGQIPHITIGQVVYDQTSGGTLPKVSSYKGSKDYTETTTVNTQTSLYPSKTDESKIEPDIIVKAFQHFVSITEKTKHYTLTPKRRKMAENRWKEAVQMVSADYPPEKVERQAKKLFGKAMDALVADEWMRDNGFWEWDQIFRSAEKFQKWIDRFDNPPEPRKENHASA